MMKKTVLYSMALLMTGLTAVSCSQNDDETQPDEPAVQTVTFVPQMDVVTRASETAFEKNDEISVFAVKGGTTLQTGGNYADNECYRYNGTQFEPTGDGILLDAEGLAYYAVYPYAANAAAGMTFDVKADQTTPAARTQSDLCTAFAATTTQRRVSMRFSHRLSRVIVKLEGENLESKKIGVSLKGVKVQTAADLNTGTFEGTGTAANVQMGQTATNTYEAIIAPQLIEAGLEFISVSVDNREVKFSQTSPLTLASGRQAEYTVDVDNVAVIAGDINPWNQEGPETQLGDVTCTNPEALKFWVTSCERVGGVVIMDFKLKNVSGRNISDLELWAGNYNMGTIFRHAAEDDLNNEYGHMLAFGAGAFEGDGFKIAQLASGETVEGHTRIALTRREGEFDPTGKAKNVTVWYKIAASDYDFSNPANDSKEGVVQFGRVPLTDNRVVTGGIQSCDRRLKFEVTGTQWTKDQWDRDVVNIDYTITNLSDEPVLGFYLHGPGSYTKCYDQSGRDLGWSLSVKGSAFEGDITTDIPARSTIKAAIQVVDNDKAATDIYCYMSCEARNSQLDDDWVRFLAVPIK